MACSFFLFFFSGAITHRIDGEPIKSITSRRARGLFLSLSYLLGSTIAQFLHRHVDLIRPRTKGSPRLLFFLRFESILFGSLPGVCMSHPNLLNRAELNMGYHHDSASQLNMDRPIC
jgi:hypothetical protein